MVSNPTHNEAALIRLVQVAGPVEASEAFHRLYDANDGPLRNYLTYSRGLQPFEIDDVCARVWERALKRLGSYEPSGVPYFIWLKRAADMVIREIFRERAREVRRTVPVPEDFDVEAVDDWGTDPLLRLLEAEDEQDATQRRAGIQVAIREVTAHLPEDSQAVLQAREELGFSAADTADLLSWKVEKVYSEYYRAKKRAREALLRMHGQEHVARWLGTPPGDEASRSAENTHLRRG